ncbi:GNAT family N-acetyltransferase [Kribbella sp. NPDC051586]|uniref:GNAT family N-acetyltransferase n=1 Tax=Kribbella sp. NPDC051586 TaxID=3364118 RepID=UPI00379EC84F
MQIESYPEAAVPTDLRRQVHALQDDAWPAAPAPSTPADSSADALVHDPALDPLSMLLIDDGTVVAALDILHKTLDHAGNTFRAGGLSTVVTRKDRRGHGYGHRLVTAARAAMTDLDLALFTCDRPLQPFYERAGFQLLPGTVLIGGTPDDPFPSDQPGFGKVTLAAFFTSAAEQAAPSFDNTRIALYPGAIDKLW